MKLESTVLRRSGFLHVAPILDVVLLLLIFFLLGSSFTLQSGIGVALPESSAILRPMSRAHVLSVSAGVPPSIYLNEELVSLADLPARLEAVRDVTSDLIIRADQLATFGLVVELTNVALGKGYSVGFATKEPQAQP